MRYKCPSCRSTKVPLPIGHFPLIIVECQECLSKGFLRQFNVDDENYTEQPLSTYL